MEKVLTASSIWKVEKNWFPLAKQPVSTSQNEGLFQKYIHNAWKIDKIIAYTTRESTLGNRMQGWFTNTFPLEGKIKQSVARVYDNGRKKWFPLPRKSVFTSRNKAIFQKLDFQ